MTQGRLVIWAAGVLGLAGTLALAQEPDEVSPLTRERFLSLVSERIPEDRFMAEVHRRGLSFGPVLEDLDAVRAAGYSLDLMLVVVRSARAAGGVKDTSGDDIGQSEAPLADEVFLNLATSPSDLSRCTSLPSVVHTLPHAEAVEAVWTAWGGFAALSDPAAQVRLAGALAVLGFPVTACDLIRDIGKGETSGRTARGASLDSDTVGCALFVLERVGTAGFDCPLEALTTWFHIGSSSLPTNVFDRFHYTVGRSLFEGGGDLESARKHLRSVRREAVDYARARLLLGLLEARLGHAAEGMRILSTLTGLTNRGPGAVSIRDMAILNMARIAHEMGLYEEALARYREIPTDSRVWVDATYERAWSALAGGYYAEALGSVVALRSPLVRPRRFHDAWVVEVAALMDRCLYREAAHYAREWAAILDRRVEEYERVLPGILKFAEKCPPECDDAEGKVIRPSVIARSFPGLFTDPGVHSLHKTALQAVREDRLLTGVATRAPALVGLEAVSRRAADRAVRDFSRALARAVAADVRALRLARSRATDVLVDLEQETLDAYLLEARAMSSGGEALPVPALIAEVEKMAREAVPPRDIKLFLAMNGRDRAFTEDEFATLRHSGVAPEVLDFARRFFSKAGPTRFEVDPSGVDPRVLWGFEGEFWTDEMLGLRVEIADRCRSLLPKMPPGFR